MSAVFHAFADLFSDITSILVSIVFVAAILRDRLPVGSFELRVAIVAMGFGCIFAVLRVAGWLTP